MSKGPNKTELAVQWLNHSNFKPFKRKELNLHLADDGATMGGPNNILYSLVEYGYAKWVNPGTYQMEQQITYEILSDCLTQYNGRHINSKKKYFNQNNTGAVQTELELLKKECEIENKIKEPKAIEITIQPEQEELYTDLYPAWSYVPAENRIKRKKSRKKKSWLIRQFQSLKKIFTSFFV